MSWSTIREEFPALKRWTYLNTATFGQVPKRSKAAMDRHFEHRNELACADFLAWFNDMDALRARVGQLVGCEADDIAFIANASAGLSTLLGRMEWKAGDQILSLEGDFPKPVLLRGVSRREGRRACGGSVRRVARTPDGAHAGGCDQHGELLKRLYGAGSADWRCPAGARHSVLPRWNTKRRCAANGSCGCSAGYVRGACV